jgi:hypothetical protein
MGADVAGFRGADCGVTGEGLPASGAEPAHVAHRPGEGFGEVTADAKVTGEGGGQQNSTAYDPALRMGRVVSLLATLSALLVDDVLNRMGRIREVAGAAGGAAALALAADHVGSWGDAAAAVLGVDEVGDPGRAEGAEGEVFWVVDAGGPAAGAGVGDQGVRVPAGSRTHYLDAGAWHLMPAGGMGDRDRAPGPARGFGGQEGDRDDEEITLGLDVAGDRDGDLALEVAEDVQARSGSKVGEGNGRIHEWHHLDV